MTEQPKLGLTLVIVYNKLSKTHRTLTLEGHGHDLTKATVYEELLEQRHLDHTVIEVLEL